MTRRAVYVAVSVGLILGASGLVRLPGAAAFIAVAGGFAIVLLVRALEDGAGPEPTTLEELRAESERRAWDELVRDQHGRFEAIAFRVVVGASRARTAHPAHVAGYRLVGGEVVKSWRWNKAWDLDPLAELPDNPARGRRVH